MTYIENQIKSLSRLYPEQKQFIAAVTEVISTLGPVFEEKPQYINNRILERLTEPERQIQFKVCYTDDDGNIKINRGYRVQFNSAIGPYKGGLRFHPSVNIDIIKFLGFEQIFKNALTGLPIGGAKGGADFDPKGKSDREIMAFCQSFMTELYRHIGPNTDVPAGDIGVGAREIGYLFGQYKKIKNAYEGSITGKDINFGGSLVRKESTGYGLIYFTNEMLKQNDSSIKDKKVCISGSGNVAIYAAEKAEMMGAKVLTMSDSNGFIYDRNGIDLKIIKKIKEVDRDRILKYIDFNKDAQYKEGKFYWDIPCDIALPCATQNELDKICAQNLINNGVIAVAEGANMPSTAEAVDLFLKNNVLFGPAKAANAGGVAVSAIEMSQNSIRRSMSFQEVDQILKSIMTNIFNKISLSSSKYGYGKNYLAGANIEGFIKVADAMIAQGVN